MPRAGDCREPNAFPLFRSRLLDNLETEHTTELFQSPANLIEVVEDSHLRRSGWHHQHVPDEDEDRTELRLWQKQERFLSFDASAAAAHKQDTDYEIEASNKRIHERRCSHEVTELASSPRVAS